MTAPAPSTRPPAGLGRGSSRRKRLMAFAVAAGIVVVAGALGAVVLVDNDGESSSREPTGGGGAGASQGAPTDPVACLIGRYRLASQAFRGPIETAFGRAELEGGKAGRSIELRPDGTFRFSDTGEASTRFTLLDNDPPTSGEATLIAEANGTYSATAETVTIDVTSLTGTLTAITDAGQELAVSLPPDGAGVEETFGFTPNARYTCDGHRVTVDFEDLSLVLERQ